MSSLMKKLIGTKSYSLVLNFERFRLFGLRIVWWYWADIEFQIIILDHCISLNIMFKWSTSHKNIWIDVYKPIHLKQPDTSPCGRCGKIGDK